MRDRMLLGLFVSIALLATGRFATAADRNAPSAIRLKFLAECFPQPDPQ